MQTRLTSLLRIHVDFESLRRGIILPNNHDPHRPRLNQYSSGSAKRLCTGHDRVSSTDEFSQCEPFGCEDASTTCCSTPSETSSIEDRHGQTSAKKRPPSLTSSRTHPSCEDGVCGHQGDPNQSLELGQVYSQTLHLRERLEPGCPGCMDESYYLGRPLGMTESNTTLQDESLVGYDQPRRPRDNEVGEQESTPASRINDRHAAPTCGVDRATDHCSSFQNHGK